MLSNIKVLDSLYPILQSSDSEIVCEYLVWFFQGQI
jgi:hypothetical protein